MIQHKRILAFAIIATFIYGCSKIPVDYTLNDLLQLGGTQTIIDEFSSAFSHSFIGLDARQEVIHEVGDKAFEATFVKAPAPLNSGLGPLYNNVSCTSCHVNDGRGKVPTGFEQSALLFRISIPGQDAHGGPLPVPFFGDQLQNRASVGLPIEANVAINYTLIDGAYPDGTPYQLRKPSYSITNNYLPLPSNLQLSPRIASPVFGLGLLQAISEKDILAHADEQDANHDGISGKPNYVYNYIAKNTELGRFGWKANQPNLLQQVAAAYNGDMGITSFVFPQENSYQQVQYDHLLDETEISDSLLHAVSFYIQTLAVPAARNMKNLSVQNGLKLFNQIGCNMCHVNNYTTATDIRLPSASNQRIKPYSDLLLHDMGEGLADYRPDYRATGYEWRTPPLWGIGLTAIVNGHTNFLHDGRARSLEEAILWHSGEAENAVNQFKALRKNEREDIILFLKNL